MTRIKIMAVAATLTGQGTDTLALTRYAREVGGLERLSVDELVRRVPEASRFAHVEPDEDWTQRDPVLPPMEEWRAVARRMQHLFDTDRDLGGIVLVHGTDESVKACWPGRRSRRKMEADAGDPRPKSGGMGMEAPPRRLRFGA
ncbi:MAG: hypothetical protein QN178_14450 [Armatimonadota bacterium]|nr:hypothetical protein [Armatimonadota bacterium]